jgi:Flp pilus assembly protein TadG
MKKEEGQAMVEFALMLPVLLLFLCGILDFGWIFGNELLASNSTREAARYTAIHYYDSTTDDDKAIAASIIAASMPSLNNPVITLDKPAGTEVITLSLKGEIPVLTPFLSAILGENFTIKAKTIMRVEN